MKKADFSFDLPESLIAQFPPEKRGESRLMLLDRKSGRRENRLVTELPSLLDKGTLLVFNNSRVRKARVPAISASGGTKVEFLLTRRLGGNDWEAMVKRPGRKRQGSRFVFGDGTEAEITGANGDFRVLSFDRPVGDEWLEINGHIPLPPYIRRGDEAVDSERYQTIYARTPGSSAAPTAGLHFTGEIFAGLERAGIGTAFVTLHVGPGTFIPVRTENIEEHIMHEESFSIDEECASRIEAAREEGRKIVAVGTTSVRALESAFAGGKIRRGDGAASIFIYPGYTFKAVDGLFTNFHTPGSTLIMLVSAFAGREAVLESYRDAVREGYRFFSYGDAMLIL